MRNIKRNEKNKNKIKQIVENNELLEMKKELYMVYKCDMIYKVNQ